MFQVLHHKPVMVCRLGGSQAREWMQQQFRGKARFAGAGSKRVVKVFVEGCNLLLQGPAKYIGGVIGVQRQRSARPG